MGDGSIVEVFCAHEGNLSSYDQAWDSHLSQRGQVAWLNINAGQKGTGEFQSF